MLEYFGTPSRPKLGLGLTGSSVGQERVFEPAENQPGLSRVCFMTDPTRRSLLISGGASLPAGVLSGPLFTVRAGAKLYDPLVTQKHLKTIRRAFHGDS